MVPRHKIDISVADLLYALGACTWAHSRRARVARILTEWGRADAVVCLSVRTAFDLLLEALALPAGSEVAVSAITHPDMVKIIERHGLVACPVDLDTETLAPRADALERALSDRTRAVLVAHLFGGHVDLSPVADVARRHRLLLVEDCAQSFRGPRQKLDAVADISLFSFGPIKTATALGGALVRVRDPALRARVAELQATLPVQPRTAYAKRVAKFVGLAVLARPAVYGLVSRRRDVDALVGRAVRGFDVSGDELFRRLRMQPCAPLLALLARRLRRFDAARLRRRAEIGEELAGALRSHVNRPGCRAVDPTHWVFPVVTGEPRALVDELRRAGFDAARATSAIAAVPPPPGRPDLEPVEACRLMAGMVFVPAYPEISARDRVRLVEAVARMSGTHAESTEPSYAR
jgi:perosamine synthetase